MIYSEEERDGDLKSNQLWRKQVGEEYEGNKDEYLKIGTFVDLNENLIKSNFIMGSIADSLGQITITFGNLANFMANDGLKIRKED
ncbi:hypothetical protein ES695_00600 [Candidatus Atribacteria bacterium 1244-E10-H5-B2]|nr:MAG: hypothetical protein ES695_00600 [Candidatus Atribacteria bacterium 1244-E10-H5-B2]